MPPFHCTTMLLRTHGVRKIRVMRRRIAEPVWWNRSHVATALVLRIYCVSTTQPWRIFGAHVAHVAMAQRTMSLIPDVRGVSTAYGARTRGVQRDWMTYAERMQSVCMAYAPRTYRFYIQGVSKKSTLFEILIKSESLRLSIQTIYHLKEHLKEFCLW